ncbi:MAG: MBL fold metallo-hydrolase [Acidobacteria bacterium]|nr:MBL fold metallo-hydrolase [Acidobacteriota bacterium]
MNNVEYNGILIERSAVEPFYKNGYVLACAQTRQAAIIDPGDEAPHLIQWIESEKMTPIAILNTHAHMDHISGVKTVREKWNIPIYLHPDDEFLYVQLEQQARWFGFDYKPAPRLDRYLTEGQELEVGLLRLRVHHTPGHSPGGVSLQVDDHVFCGDVIFAGSIGRTDLPGGSYETLIRSIREKLLPLGDHCILHPGHGPDTTVGRERTTNPFLTS